MNRRMLALAVLTLLVAACGHHGGGHAPTLVYKVVDLGTGAVADRYDDWDPRTATDAQMVFRRVPADGAAPAFWCGVFEVTQAQWAALGGAAASVTGTDAEAAAIAPRKPMFGVTLQQALARCDAYDVGAGATATAHHRLDVPSAAQWTRAAGVASGFGWGTTLDPAAAQPYAVVAETRASQGPATVGSRAPNALGLWDIHGNVWELTIDDVVTGDAILRGGSWRDNLVSAASDVAPTIHDDTAHPLVGVRLVLTLL